MFFNIHICTVKNLPYIKLFYNNHSWYNKYGGNMNIYDALNEYKQYLLIEKKVSDNTLKKLYARS